MEKEHSAIDTNSLHEFKQLEWDHFYPPKIQATGAIICESKFKLPEWVNEKRECKVNIRDYTDHLGRNVYVSTLWWFNRGIGIVGSVENVRTINGCIDLTNERLFDLATIFLSKK